MSRTISEGTPSPASRYYEWAGKVGVFEYFDKTKVDAQNPKGTNVTVPLPFRFLVLDILSSVGGFNDADNTGIYSNDVKDQKTQQLTVKTYKGTLIASGYYDLIKDKVKAAGGKFAASLYISYYDEDRVLKIGHLKLLGTALSAWIDFVKANKAKAIYAGSVLVEKSEHGKKGSNEFETPVFQLAPVKPETSKLADELDAELQSYLLEYFRKGGRDEAPEAREIQPAPTPTENVFQRKMKEKNQAQPVEEVAAHKASTDDLPF